MALTERLAFTPNSPADGIRIGRKRVARLMREMALAGISRRKGTRTTRRDPRLRPAPDLVERRFEVDAPDVLWVADITYVPTWAGFLFLAVVVDAFSRRVVGWSMANHLRTELVLEALNMALWQRHVQAASSITPIKAANTHRTPSANAAVRWVLNRPWDRWGDCFDNAMAESFFATLECELIDRRVFRTQAEARMAIFEYIEGWYNPHRRHSGLGYLSPLNFERSNQKAA